MTKRKGPKLPLSTTRAKPGPKRIELDYDEVAFHCRSRKLTTSELARKLHISRDTLDRRLKSDKNLRDAMEGGYEDGKNIVADAMFKKMLDRYLTICKDCGKLRFSFDGFYESCPYCDKVEPDMKGTHTNVRHKFISGDSGLMIFWAKNNLGMSEKVTHEGDADKPLVFSTLAEFSIHMAKSHDQKKARVKAPQAQTQTPAPDAEAGDKGS